MKPLSYFQDDYGLKGEEGVDGIEDGDDDDGEDDDDEEGDEEERK